MTKWKKHLTLARLQILARVQILVDFVVQLGRDC